MKKFLLIFALSLTMFFILPFSAKAQTCGCESSGTTPELFGGWSGSSTISFSVLNCECENEDDKIWFFTTRSFGTGGGNFFSDCFENSGTKNYNFDLPVGDYIGFRVCSATNEAEPPACGRTCTLLSGERLSDMDITYEPPITILQSEEETGGGVFFTLPENLASSTLAYVSVLFTDLKMPIYLLIGFALFFLVANWLIKIMEQKEENKKGFGWRDERILAKKETEAEKVLFKEGGIFTGKGRGGSPRKEWNERKKKWV